MNALIWKEIKQYEVVGNSRNNGADALEKCQLPWKLVNKRGDYRNALKPYWSKSSFGGLNLIWYKWIQINFY